jgi:aryl-alcohol dehydrogenase-like predicted oxidoreductase
VIEIDDGSAMEYRELGRTGLKVSTIGMGCWAIGGDAWGPVDDRDSTAAIDRALELGINLFDTADVYGRGRSEELVGGVLNGRRGDAIIATKVGLWHSGGDRPNAYTRPEMVIESCEASLRRLQTDRIDVYQCHLWWDENTEVFVEAFERLKTDGKIGAYGVSTNDIDHLKHFDQNRTCEIHQFDYSILNRSAERELLPYAHDRGMGTLARGSLRMGILTGKFTPETTFPEGDVRREWLEQDWYGEQLADAEQLKQLANGRRLSQVALAFVLAHPAVSTTIPGAKTPEQIEQNAAAANIRLSDEDRRLIDEVAPPP